MTKWPELVVRAGVPAAVLIGGAMLMDTRTDDWTLRHGLPFIIAAPLLAVMFARGWERRAVVASAAGAALGLGFALATASATGDNDTSAAALIFMVYWSIPAFGLCWAAAAGVGALIGRSRRVSSHQGS